MKRKMWASVNGRTVDIENEQALGDGVAEEFSLRLELNYKGIGV